VTDLFNGEWKIDLRKSKVWDSSLEQWVPDPVGREEVRMTIDGDLHDYEVICRVNPTYRLGYTVRYNSMAWVPYEVRGVVEDEASRVDDDPDSPGDNRRVPLTVGQPLGLVSLVKIDDGYHYRISKKLDGSPDYILQRQITDDGAGFTSTVVWADGHIGIVKVFSRA
jgi:hypothetical protein